jgi:Ni/Fe-hydrogenase subunit HybB-like protein
MARHVAGSQQGYGKGRGKERINGGSMADALPEVEKEIGKTPEFTLRGLKPKGKWLTPFIIISTPIILLGIILIVIRFAKGLGAVTNLSQDFPWGLWIAFDVNTGIAFAGGAYVLTFIVYILRIKKYKSLIRVTVLNGFLAYVFYAGALLIDLGRPWNAMNPIIGNSFGFSSILFLVAWHFLLYMIAELVEFSPAIAEWLGLRRVRRFLSGMTLGAVVLGITLSTLHQSGLGALFLMAKGKIHPLWYTEYIPILYFISSIFAGLSMVIFEGTISRRVFDRLIDSEEHRSYPSIMMGLAKMCAGTMFVYLFLQALLFIHEKRWLYIGSPMGYWYLTELIGFVLIPCLLFLQGLKRESQASIRIAAILSLLGIVLNRLNVSIIAFKWYAPVRYVPSWKEVVITLAIIFAEIWVFRWIVSRMPVLSKPPGWALKQDAQEQESHNPESGKEPVNWKHQVI